MPTESSVLINVNEILSFFDEKPDWADKHSAGVVGMIFEDLAAATLEHYLHRNGVEHVAIRTEPVTTGQKKGPWLDRWIEADLAGGQKVLFQTEIKSVSAHSTGHKRIMLNASVEDMREHEQENWDGQWNSETNTLRHQPMAKVLVPMKRPRRHRGQAPPAAPDLLAAHQSQRPLAESGPGRRRTPVQSDGCHVPIRFPKAAQLDNQPQVHRTLGLFNFKLPSQHQERNLRPAGIPNAQRNQEDASAATRGAGSFANGLVPSYSICKVLLPYGKLGSTCQECQELDAGQRRRARLV